MVYIGIESGLYASSEKVVCGPQGYL